MEQSCKDCLQLLKNHVILPITVNSYTLTDRQIKDVKLRFGIWKNKNKDNVPLLNEISNCVDTILDKNKCGSFTMPNLVYQLPEIKKGYIETNNSNIYTFEKLLGQGTYGQVWKAVANNGKEVAIKIFKGANAIRDYNRELTCLNRVSAECRYAVCLQDSYIKDKPRIVIDYIDGTNLDNILDPRSDK
jgi:serine/threonine protein kinase